MDTHAHAPYRGNVIGALAGLTILVLTGPVRAAEAPQQESVPLAGPEYGWRQTDTSLALLCHGRVLWQHHHDPEQGKPLMDLCLPDGTPLTRPWPIPEGAISVPTGYVEFPKEILRPPRSVAARVYSDIRRWTAMEKGGHFAAREQPEALAREIREFFRPLRS